MIAEARTAGTASDCEFSLRGAAGAGATGLLRSMQPQTIGRAGEQLVAISQQPQAGISVDAAAATSR